MTDTDPQSRESGAVCDINVLVRDLMEHERHCFDTYKHGHRWFDDTPAKQRWHDAKKMLETVVEFAQTLVTHEEEE